MKVIFYTHDLFIGREHLMPWRTLIEVAKYFQNAKKWKVKIFSGEINAQFVNRFYQDINIISVPKPSQELAKTIEKENADILYWPVVWRDRKKSFSDINSFKGNIIAYFPGGVYNITNIIKAIPLIGIKAALPYVFEIITPKSFLINKLKKNGFAGLIAFSNFTFNKAINAGWIENEGKVIFPGKGTFQTISADQTLITDLKLNGKKFFVFMGAPAPIRGSKYLLKAFDRFASKNKESVLVCLMRKDPDSDFSRFNDSLNKLKNQNNVIPIYDLLSPNQLKGFIDNAIAVILPFIMIPSEIPLTFFEVLSCGTPILTFTNGGTSEYISGCSLISRPGNTNSLSRNMEEIWENKALRTQLSLRAKELMKNHPTWKQVGENWANFIYAIL